MLNDIFMIADFVFKFLTGSLPLGHRECPNMKNGFLIKMMF